VAVAAASAMALPFIGPPLLGVVGFTSAGVVSGDYLGYD